jgi:ubiquinone/menaquinone biosynthesis C-methylase UbiE
MVLFRRPWEHRTRRQMQEALAGGAGREWYLDNRVDLARELRRILAVEEAARGFEIGSGEGVMARELAPHCAALDCTDISRTFLKLARATCRDVANVRFHHIRSDYLDFLPAASYDFGYSVNVFIHLSEYDVYHYLRSVERLLKPGGRFYFTEAAVADNTWELFRAFADRYRRRRVVTPGFMRWHGLDLVRGLILRAGLEIDEDAIGVDGGHLKVLVRKAERHGVDAGS